MRYHYSRFFMFLFVISCLGFVLAACGDGTANGGGPTPTSTSVPSTGPTHVPTGVPTSVPVPTTLTSCPVAGTGRAAVMTSMSLGSHATIVYTVNEGSPAAPTFGTVKSYNVATGAKFEIVKQANTRISEAQVSANGQWVLFVAIVSGQPELQLVRVDGKEWQTLYCGITRPGGANPASALEHVQWSTNERSVVFDSFQNGGTPVFLLNLSTGSVETLLAAHSGHFYYPLTWLDSTQIFLGFAQPDNYAATLDLIDSARGANQPESALRMVYTNGATYPCWDFDTSYDGAHRFTSQCSYTPSSQHPGPDVRQGPGSIFVQGTYGGPGQTVYSSAKFAVTTVRVFSTSTLLFLINNNKFSRGGGVDTSENGLWKVNMDGSGLTRLTSDTAAINSVLNSYTQYPWSNVSRDGSIYALGQGTSTTSTLLYGSINGGKPTVFASIVGAQLAIAGWTTM